MPRSPYRIQIADEQTAQRIDTGLLIRVARSALRTEQVRGADLSVALVDDAQMHQINREFLKHDYPTDVLSFLLDETQETGKTSSRRGGGGKGRRGSIPPRGAGKTLAGEIIIGCEYAVRIAGAYGWSPADEVLLYLVHGVLHLCGYDDQTPRERARMRSREVEVLQLWNRVPQYAE